MLVRLFIVTLFLCPIFLNLWPILCRVNFVCFLEFFLDSFARIYFSCPPHLIRCQCCRSIRTHSRLSTRLLLLQCGQLSCRAWDRRVRGKRGGFSPEPAARHSRPSRVPQTIPKTVFPLQIQPESRKQSQIWFFLEKLGWAGGFQPFVFQHNLLGPFSNFMPWSFSNFKYHADLFAQFQFCYLFFQSCSQ